MNAANVASSDYARCDRVGAPAVSDAVDRNAGIAVCWAAIVAGAAGAAALSLCLLTLGVGFGMAIVSPWSPDGIGASELGMSSIAWITLTSILASALGGYLAGRLRMRWADTLGDEVFFRDTAHGFLTWAVATLVTASLLASVVTSIVGSGVQAGATVAGANAAAAASGMAGAASDSEDPSSGYFVDMLFRQDPASAPAMGYNGASAERTSSDTLEVQRIFTQVLGTGSLPTEDLRHLAQMVASRTGMGQAAAEARVSDTFNRAQTAMREAQQRAMQAADTAREATAYGSLWLFIALLAGAFVASLAATLGGRQRDT